MIIVRNATNHAHRQSIAGSLGRQETRVSRASTYQWKIVVAHLCGRADESHHDRLKLPEGEAIEAAW